MEGSLAHRRNRRFLKRFGLGLSMSLGCALGLSALMLVWNFSMQSR
jgi:hypothetical protein